MRKIALDGGKVKNKEGICIECMLEQVYGSLLEVPDAVILNLGGCPYCAMTGYEDYPANKVKCRLGHKDMGRIIAKNWRPRE